MNRWGKALLKLHVMQSEARRAVDSQETERAQEQLPVLTVQEVLTGGQELEVGPFPLNQTPKHPFGLPQVSPAQPPCAPVRHTPTNVECVPTRT
jgi:hypothetical protein